MADETLNSEHVSRASNEPLSCLVACNCCHVYRDEDWLSIQLYCTRAVNQEGVHVETESDAAQVAEEIERQRFQNSESATTLGKQAKYASAFRFQPGWDFFSILDIGVPAVEFLPLCTRFLQLHVHSCFLHVETEFA